MKIDVRQFSQNVAVEVSDGNVVIDLGMFNEIERDELAQTLLGAAWDMGPGYDCAEWFAKMLGEMRHRRG